MLPYLVLWDYVILPLQVDVLAYKTCYNRFNLTQPGFKVIKLFSYSTALRCIVKRKIFVNYCAKNVKCQQLLSF